MKPRTVSFLSGTRADWGKQRSLIRATRDAGISTHVFATGMHLEPRYGFTVIELAREPCLGVYPCQNRVGKGDLPVTFARTVEGLGDYLDLVRPELLVVHGDRSEALAGAYVGAAKGVRVAHIEGGDVSGTLDEGIRHAVTKISHLHLVAGPSEAQRVVRLGEDPDSVHIIGSPNLDAMRELPEWREVRDRYALPGDPAGYTLLLWHPVVTNPEETVSGLRVCFREAQRLGGPVVAIYPNADPGSDEVIAMLEHATRDGLVDRIIPSMRFDHFLVALREASVVIGNSSALVHEAPMFGTPTKLIGTRQQGRRPKERAEADGRSAERFVDLLTSGAWRVPLQKTWHTGATGGAS